MLCVMVRETDEEKTLMTSRRAQVHCGSWEASQGAPGPRVVRRTHPMKRVSVSDLCRFLPGVAGCQACALPDGQTAAGLFQDAFWRE